MQKAPPRTNKQIRDKMEQLTIKEAIEKGYTKYGFANREWQSTNDLNDGVFVEVAEDDWEDLVLFEKNSQQPTIEAETIADMLADLIADSDAHECGRDDDSVYKAVKEIDYTDIVDKINKELEQHSYWMLTDIKLTK